MGRIKAIRHYHVGLGTLCWFLHVTTGPALLVYVALQGFVVYALFRGEASFQAASEMLMSPAAAVVEVLLRLCVFYHVLNGARVIVFDAGWYGVEDQHAMQATVLIATGLLFALHFCLAATYVPAFSPLSEILH